MKAKDSPFRPYWWGVDLAAAGMDARAPVPSPKGGGHLVRFLSDRESGLYWYLHMIDDGADHAVVCSPYFYGSMVHGTQLADPEDICFCAESFEAFLCRFWLENEIWFAVTDGTPMPTVGVEYIKRYRSSAD
ncbi:MAG: hypothetical protein QOC94_1391 [Actinoplanes sp.]|nr:hypothetical protein [Actinoplanes sp.]